ncbi:MAG: hypothetical protein ABSF94_21155 [Steroidobacteraceae bacterium]|jgi:hypothetical protein
MSEVDRLSNSGIFPALPIGDKHRSKDQPGSRQPPDKPVDNGKPQGKPGSQSGAEPEATRQPKSIIDEYA